MNHTIKLILCSLALFLSIGNIFAIEEGTDIIIEENVSMEGPMFRDPTVIPISAVFYTTPSVIEVQFLMDLGYVSVEIENLTTSGYTQTVVNSAAGLAIFPISGNPGLWTITFSLSNGTVYYGEFNL